MRRDDSDATANHSSASSGGNGADEREGADTSAQARDSAEGVLQPDVSFGADPRVHIAHSLVITAGYLTSIGLLLAYIPLSRKPGEPEHLGLASAPWLAILLPFIAASICGAAFHVYFVMLRKRAIEMQLGPPPNPETTVGGAILQHSILSRVFMKQYVASNISDAVLFIGMACSAAVCLGYVLKDNLPIWRVVVLPFAAAGIASLILHTMYRIRCSFPPVPTPLHSSHPPPNHTHAACRGRGALPSVSTRTDFMVVFVYLVAYKLDSDASLSWTVRTPDSAAARSSNVLLSLPVSLPSHAPKGPPSPRRPRAMPCGAAFSTSSVQVTFIFGFWWVCVSVLIGVCALMVSFSGRRAGVWTPAGLRIRIANAAAHLAAALLLAATVLLLTFMRAGHDLRSGAAVRHLRGALACTAAWLAASAAAHVVVWAAQREREAQRRRQIADGAVWTALYNTVHGWTTLVQHVDSLSSEEIAQKVRCGASGTAVGHPTA